jgi:RES domain-containing protein
LGVIVETAPPRIGTPAARFSKLTRPLSGVPRDSPKSASEVYRSAGGRAVFTSATLSLAALERFVNTDPDLDVVELVAVPVDIGADVAIEAVAVEDLPRDWRDYPAPPSLAAIGERWLAAGRAAVLSVPSVVIPAERNLVLNSAHADFSELTILRPEPFSFDPRTWSKTR